MRASLLLALSLAAVPVAAQQMPTKAPGEPIPSRVTAGTYKVEPSHTQVLFTVTHLGFTNYTGQFVNPTGTLVLDPKNPARDTLDIRFPIAQVSTTVGRAERASAKARILRRGEISRRAVRLDGGPRERQTAEISGNLTLKGVTKPVTLHARFIGAGPAPMGPPKLNIGFAATTSIKRSDFGISYGVPLVSDRVDLVINAAFVAE